MLPKRSQKILRTVPSEVQTVLAAQFGVSNASNPQLNSKTLAIVGAKWLQNFSKIIKKSRNIDAKADFEFNLIFGLIFDELFQ